MAKAGSWITEDISSSLCSKVFDSDTIEQLKLTLANGDIVPLHKQFYTYFKGQLLKYDFDELLVKAITIFDYAKQEVKKYKFAKEQLDKLNDPVSFFNLNISDNKGSAVNASINISETENKGKNNTFNASRGNTANIGEANAVARAGASQLNEEYKDIEEHWRKEDSKYYQIKQEKAKETLDIDIPKDLENIDLNTILTTTDNLVLTKEEETLLREAEQQEQDIQPSEISYTGINLNKSSSSSSSKNTNTNKALNLNATKSTNESNTVNSGLNTTNNESSSMNFVYGDATYKALGLYVSNFREAFFSSFCTLFVEPWTGY